MKCRGALGLSTGLCRAVGQAHPEVGSLLAARLQLTLQPRLVGVQRGELGAQRSDALGTGREALAQDV